MTRISCRPSTGRIATLAFCLTAPLCLCAQTPTPTATLSVSTHLVQMTVIVRDSNGPVNGLTAEDFTVLDQRKPRKISIFSAEPAVAAQPVGPVLSQNEFSDRAQSGAPAAGNVTIILLDNLNTLQGSGPLPFEDEPRWLEAHAMASAKQHLLATIKQLDPRDRIAVYSLGPLSPALRRLCDFTCTRDELLAAVKRYDPSSMTLRDISEPGTIHLPLVVSGDSSPSGLLRGIEQTNTSQAAFENGKRGQITMMGLSAIAQQMVSIPGRKSLLWLTANLPFSGEAIASILVPARIAAYPVDARGLIHMTSGTTYPSWATGVDAMNEMAEDTGGHAYVNDNDISSAIREVIEQPVAAYTIGFYVDGASVDGKFHAVKLKVGRPAVRAQYPRGYFATKDRQLLPDHGRGALLAALHSPFDLPAIPFNVTIARVEQPQPHMLALTGSVGIQEISLPQQGDVRLANLDVYTVEQDAAGKILHQATDHMALRLTEEQYKAYLTTGITFRDLVQPPTGTTVVRVLVRDPASQKIGSVVIPLAQVR